MKDNLSLCILVGICILVSIGIFTSVWVNGYREGYSVGLSDCHMPKKVNTLNTCSDSSQDSNQKMRYTGVTSHTGSRGATGKYCITKSDGLVYICVGY